MVNSFIKIKNIQFIKILLITTFCVSIAAGQSAVQANGGYTERIDFAGYSYSEHWLGFYGVITNNTMIVGNSDIKNEVAIFTGISLQDGDYILITASPSPPMLSGLRAGNIASVDEITGLGGDSGSNTFTYSSSYRIPYSDATITDVPSIYMFDGMDHYFREALFSDDDGNPVFAVPIEHHDQDTSSHYFQLMLPDNGNLTYYLFYVPSDTQ